MYAYAKISPMRAEPHNHPSVQRMWQLQAVLETQWTFFSIFNGYVEMK